MKFMIHIKNYLIAYLLLILLGILVVIIPKQLSHRARNNIKATDTYLALEDWQYRWGDPALEEQFLSNWTLEQTEIPWKKFNVPGQPPNKQALKEVWLRTQLPIQSFKDPAIFFMTNDQCFEVYLEGEVIYRFGEFNASNKNQAPGSPWHMISLPPDYNGKTLFIRMHTIFTKNAGLIRKAELNSRSEHLLSLVTQDTSDIILALLFIFIGTGMMCVFLLKKREQNPFFSVAFGSICIGVWLIAEGNVKQIFLDAPRVWLYIAMTAFFLIPVGFCIFVEQVFVKKHGYVLRGLAYLAILFTITTLLLDFTNLLPIVCVLPYDYILLVICLFTCIGFVLPHALRGNIEARLFFLGFIILTFSGIYDILGWFYMLLPWSGYITKWGMLGFILTLVIILGRRFVEIHDKVEIYSEVIKSKEESLHESQKLLDEAIKYDRLKTEFFANISHELRTPLNIVLATVQLLYLYLQDGSLISSGNKISNHLKVVQQNCFRLIRLVNNLIDITKIDAGYFDIHLENLNIVEIIEDITLSVADYIKSKGIHLIFDTEIEEKIMAFDPDKIERILLNLLSNAVKFSKPGAEIEVFIEDLKDRVRIQVKDTGIGIAEDKLDSIFERFVQVDRSLTRNHEGSGIGLSLVKALVEKHEGTISVESELGKGTTFLIELPAKIISTVKSTDKSKISSSYNHVEKINIEFSDTYS